MVRRLLAIGLLLLPVLGLAQQAPTAEQVQGAAQRLRAALARYETLTHDLDLNSLPGNLPEYPAVTELLDHTGARLEPLSRTLMRGDQLTAPQWQQLQTDLTDLDAALDELTRRSFSLRVWAFTHNQGVKRPDWGLAVSDSLHKLPRERAACVAVVTDTVILRAARGEAESAQVVVVPLGKDLKAVQVTCKGLRGAGTTLPGTAVQCQPLGYLPLDPPVYEPPWRGWWPDVLLPAGPVDVIRDQVQPLWLTVTVPATQKPGDYQGDLFVKPANGGTLRLTIKLTVWNFGLPEKSALPVEARLDAKMLARWYGGPGVGEADPRLTERFVALLRGGRVLLPETTNEAAPAVDLAGGDAVGQKAWWVLTPQLAPPLPNLWIDRPALEQRLLPWLAWQTGCLGLRLGSANEWAGNLPHAPTTAGITLNTWLTPRPAGCVGNGLGQLLYPGPGGQPLASLRLAVLRDGLEDYDTLALAQALADKDETVRKLLAERSALVQSLLDGRGGPGELLAWRTRLGELLSKSGGEGAASGH